MMALALVILIFTSNLFVNSQFVYPNVYRNESVVDNLFGTHVPDPYRWLENSPSPETTKFVKSQNNVTQSFIRSNPNWNAVKSSFSELYNYTKYDLPSKEGNQYYQSIKTPKQNQPIIYSFTDLNDESTRRVFLDPNTFSLDGTTSLAFASFSPDGSYCVYGTSKGGSDWTTLYVRNVSTLTDLKEKLIKVKLSSIGWNKNNDGFFYAYYDTYEGVGEGTETNIPLNQKLYYHKLNTSQKEDIKIYKFSDKPKWRVKTPRISEDGTVVHLFPAVGTLNTPWLFSKFDPKNITKLNFTWIVPEPNAAYNYVGSNENCTYVLTNYKAKNFRLVCVDLNNYASENWVDILPGHEKWVLSDTLIVNRHYLIAVYMIDVVDVIRVYNLRTGEFLFDVKTPIGTISSLEGNVNGTEFFYKIITFLSPGIVYRYDFKTNETKIFKQSVVQGINADDFMTKQIYYPSKDGTKVPMFLVHRKSLVQNRKNPTRLYAYGGFNINIQPEYDSLGVFFARNLNGIYAMANIRGGGEFGDDWHGAGMRLNKQNVFDDFAYAALWLIESNYTSKEYLTIDGRSNGGLLVGASCNQRPDLFGAALANVGVMDMIRFPLFSIGHAWTEEYGDPQNNKEQFEYIYKYSPLHNIRSEMSHYPNTLVTTADHDDRVVPAHSYKYISELQYRLGAKLSTPLMIRIDTDSGHGSGKSTSKLIEENTDKVCFLLNVLPYKYQP